eukprot:CAMPEP_0202448276 /NCGR_PEP_ID=MMETSP1360-20130828/7092_1 /ASSEMBLY_ACC=CAM_ASM_000848 /TAXON_ID=515479 /ORGANISM="Licmophora paradoxa, Strain CCMP2313" /LENGTH=168 /DNA_ID=CAMNT_0049065781 /DNA_START=54 /DNA_END=557 /DNA_ORIENTATION=-
MSSDLRQRKKNDKTSEEGIVDVSIDENSNTKNEKKTHFEDIKSSDAALLQQTNTQSNHTENQNNNNNHKKGLTFIGRLVIFLGIPFLVGISGLYVGYLRKLVANNNNNNNNNKDSPKQTVDFDNDFVFPFLVALTMAIVVGFQTNGYTTTNITPLIKWPQVRRHKKFI